MENIFETSRLIFRRFTEADAVLVLDLNSDPEVLKYLHEPKIRDEAHAKEILQNIILPQYKNNLGRWAIHTKDNNEFIGWCGLKQFPEIQEIDLGYRFKKSSWGKGYATEAARQTMDYGFTHLKIPVITGRAHIKNIASWKVLEKIGMQFVCEEIVDECPVKKYEKQVRS
ncbi:MAG: GNAT family N-acetyltransferase [Ferruginibacter sp.]